MFRAPSSSPEIASEAANIRKQAMNRVLARLLFRSQPMASLYLPATNSAIPATIQK
jgi:hypothetical protein